MKNGQCPTGLKWLCKQQEDVHERDQTEIQPKTGLDGMVHRERGRREDGLGIQKRVGGGEPEAAEQQFLSFLTPLLLFVTINYSVLCQGERHGSGQVHLGICLPKIF